MEGRNAIIWLLAAFQAERGGVKFLCMCAVEVGHGCGYRGETAAQHAVWKGHTAPDVVERHVLATHTWQVAVTHKTADIIQIVALLGIGRADKIIGHFDGGCQHRTAIATGIELHAVLEIAVVALQSLSRIEFHREKKLVDGKIKVAFVFLERRAINPLQGNVHFVGARTLRPALIGPFADALLPREDIFFRCFRKLLLATAHQAENHTHLLRPTDFPIPPVGADWLLGIPII